MFGVFPFGAPYFGQANAQSSVIDAPYLTDFAWVDEERFAPVDSDPRFAWVPAASDREVER